MTEEEVFQRSAVRDGGGCDDRHGAAVANHREALAAVFDRVEELREPTRSLGGRQVFHAGQII